MRGSNARNSNTLSRVSRPMSGAVTYLRAQYASVPHAPKLVAGLAERSFRTAEKWLTGERDPDLESALNIARHDPEFRARLLQAMENE